MSTTFPSNPVLKPKGQWRLVWKDGAWQWAPNVLEATVADELPAAPAESFALAA